MAATVVGTPTQASGVDAGSLQIASHTHPSGANCLVVFACYGLDGSSNQVVSGAGTSFNSQNLTRIGGHGNGDFVGTEAWRLFIDGPVTAAVNVDFSGLPNGAAIFAVSLQDADVGGTPFGTVATGSGTTGGDADNATATATTTASNLVLASIASDSQGGITVVASGTEILESPVIGSDTVYACQQKTASGSSTAMSWDQAASTGWAVIAFQVNQAGGGGGAAPPTFPMRFDRPMRAQKRRRIV